MEPAIGDLIASLSAANGAAAVFTLLENPNGYLSISGSQILAARTDIPIGIPLPYTVSAIAPGFSFILADTLTYSPPAAAESDPFPMLF